MTLLDENTGAEDLMADPGPSRRTVLKALGLGSASLAVPGLLSGARATPAPEGAGAGVRQGARRPNVVVMITDDQGYGDLSCHGNPVLRTPHLDRLHGESVRFTDFHVSPTCSPSRAALLTGRYPNRTGVWHTIMGRSQLRRDEVTLADLFRSAGYRTGIFGKWHLGDNHPYRPMDRGFDESLVLGGGAIGNAPDYWGNDYFDDTYRRNGAWERVEGYCTDVFFDEAMGFMEDAGTEPFFVYLATNTPHWPHIAPERFNAPYRDRVPERMATFYGMIASIDENVGRLTRFLDRTGLARDTIVVFLTDNGTSFGWYEDDEAGTVGFNAGMRGRKGSVWEGGHRVPFFVRWPGGGIGGAGAGRDVDALSAHVDVLPTLAELCALPVPDGLELDGTSLRPLLGGAEPSWDPRTLVVDNQRVDHPIRWKDCAVMDGRWRLVNGAALYDIGEDPAQTTDVAAAHPATVARLRDAYEAWWDATSARFDEYTRVPLGTPHEDPVVLTSHDVHGQVAWDQVHVRRNTPCDGFWAVDVARPGRYRVRIRRWPEESGLALLDTPEGAEPMRPTHGRLKVAGFDGTRPVEAGARSVDFEVELPAGPTRLQAWLVDGRENGRVNSAFYVEVERR